MQEESTVAKMVPAGFSTGRVRTRLNVPEHRLIHFIRSGALNVPIVDGKRVWSEGDVKKAAELLGVSY